jgi:nitrogen fixation protein NifQ
LSTYTETIRRWATDTRRAGTLSEADGTGEVGLDAGEAGKRIAVRFALRVRDEKVEKIRYQVFGCGFSMAACAAAAELAEGRLLEEARKITKERVDGILGGLPPERAYCADLAVEALQAAVTGALGGTKAVQAVVHQPLGEEHGPLVRADDPVYRALMESTPPPGIIREDRHLFACLLAVASQEPYGTAEALGLTSDELAALLETCFPATRYVPPSFTSNPGQPPPEPNPDVLAVLLSHVPKDESGREIPSAAWLARMVGARSAHPGHLWTTMGLFERPELTAAIRRHLPSLADANSQGMRWKRFLYKQVCDLHGAVLCKSPNCGVCSDYAICFAPE